MHSIYNRMDEIRDEMIDISRQRLVVNADTLKINETLRTTADEATRRELKSLKAENTLSIMNMDARVRELKAELHRLSSEQGTIFERTFIKVAKANLPADVYERLVDQATRLAGIPAKKEAA